MQENEFEKKVQQQLNELQLRPSATVWEGVEKELQKKKKRHLIAFFFLLAGLSLLGYFAYIILPGHSNTTIVEKQNNIAGNTQQSVTPALPVISSTHKQQPEEAANNKPLPAHSSVKEDSKSEFIITQAAPHPVNKEAIINSASQNNTNNKEETITGSTSLNTTSSKEITTELTNEKPTNSPAASIATKDSLKKIELTSQPQITIPDQKRAHKKMKWGFEFSPGLSYNATNPFSPVPSSKAMAVNDGLTNYSVPSGTGFPGNPGYIIQPSAVKAGFAFKVGIVGEMKLSKKSSLVTGLRYAYMSDNIKVGDPLGYLAVPAIPATTSTPTGQYSGAYGIPQKYVYTNQYHFVEIPLSYQLQLNNSKKPGFLWNAGLSVSYLFATNALVYDTVSHGMYNKDKGAFTKLHINASTGLSFQFGGDTKTQWSLGPVLSMDMSPLMKQNEILKKRYLIYGGINARFFLNKK